MSDFVATYIIFSESNRSMADNLFINFFSHPYFASSDFLPPYNHPPKSVNQIINL